MRLVKAFTLLELIVGMFIFAIIAGVGIISLLNFRNTIKLRERATNLVIMLKTTLNDARNNIYSEEENLLFASGDFDTDCTEITGLNVFIPDAVGYYFTQNSIHKIKCIQKAHSILGNFCCKDFGSISGDLNVQDSDLEYRTNCGAIFEYSTGDILTFVNDGLSWSSSVENITGLDEICNINLFNVKSNIEKNVIIDGNENSIYVEN